MNRSSFWIGTLLFTAIVMAIMLVALPPMNRPAYADNISQGVYRLMTPAYGSIPEGYVTVMTSDGKMITYQLMVGNPGRMQIIAVRDVAKDLTLK